MTTADPSPVLLDLLRVSLVGAEPEVWRLLEVPADLVLSDLHEVIQIAFGWRGSGTHAFTDTEGQRWLGSEGTGGPGRLDTGARLRDVLTPEMGPLVYAYGTDGGWEHLVELTGSRPAAGAEGAPRLVDGAGGGPLEGTAGIEDYAYLVQAWSDPEDERHTSARRWADQSTGPWRPPFDPTQFDPETARRALTDRFDPSGRDRWSPDLTDLVDRLDVGVRPELVARLGAAELDRPVVVEPAEAEATTSAYRWLLSHVGAHGVQLSGGWLPPETVREAGDVLGWVDTATDAPERGAEVLMHFRQTAIRTGLLRKQKNTLQLTTVGYRLSGDAPGLWWHLAGRWLPTKRSGIERDAAILLAVDLATGRSCSQTDRMTGVAYGLHALGWVNADDRGPVDPSDVQPLLAGDLGLFADLGLLHVDPAGVSAVAPPGRLLARAMLSVPGVQG